MANNRERARARRELQKGGGVRISTVAIPCKTSWTEILAEQGMLPFWHDGKHLSISQLQAATEKLIAEWCRDWQAEKAEAILSGCKMIRTGALAREPAPDPTVSWVPSAGGHWSYRPGGKKDKGRKFTSKEIKAYLKEHAEIGEGFRRA